MARTFVPYELDQPFLLPPDLREWVPEGHLGRFLVDVVASLDLDAIVCASTSSDARDRGRAAYDPRMLTTLLLYAYCVGRPSSRKIERATYEEIVFRFLAANQHPDHNTIARFRQRNLTALAALFVQVLRLCQHAGLAKLGHVALDGTKVGANASKHKAMSHERMAKSEAELAAEVERLLAEAQRTDAEEDAEFGPDRRGDELPDELARQQSRLAKIQEAKAALEAEAAAARARALAEHVERVREKERDAPPEQAVRVEKRMARLETKLTAAQTQAQSVAEAAGSSSPDLTPYDIETLPQHRVAHDRRGAPKPTAQRNFTDPDSRIMARGGTYEQAYNCQAAVNESQVIVAVAVTNHSSDVQHLRPMLSEIERNCGELPDKMSADSGYWSQSNAEACEARGVDAYISTSRQKHGAKKTDTVAPSDVATARDRMRQKLASPAGRSVYARRKAIVEPVFGQIKEPRGLRRFLLRGLDAVPQEWSLIALTHNLLKLHRSGWSPVLAP